MPDDNSPSRRDAPPSLHDIVRRFGGVLLDNGRSALIPGPSHSRKDRSVSLRQLPDGRILIHCFSPKDDWREVQAMLRAGGAAGGPPPCRGDASVVDAAHGAKIARARELWARAAPLPGTPAETYLRARCILRNSWPSALRYLPEATSIDDRRRRPALIAAISNASGDVQGVHITLLSPCGQQKAHVQTPKRTIGALRGGAVRLRDGAGADVLIAAEGIENALSASRALSLPADATLTAGNLARFDPPDEIARLVIAADRGPAGEAAAKMLARRIAARNLPTEIALAPNGYADWNDWARRLP